MLWKSIPLAESTQASDLGSHLPCFEGAGSPGHHTQILLPVERGYQRK